MTTTPDTPPPTLPAPLLARLDALEGKARELGYAERGGKSPFAAEQRTSLRAELSDIRSSLLRELWEYVADRERIDWHRQQENERCGYDAYPTLDEYRRALDTLRHMSARTPSPQARDTDG